MRILWKYFSQHKARFLLSIVLLVAVDVLQLFIPLVVKRVVDGLSTQITISLLTRLATAVVAIGFAMFVLRIVWRTLLASTAQRIAANLRERFYSKLLMQPHSFFTKWETGDLMARATNDMGAVRMLFSFAIVGVVDTVVLGAAALGFMLYLNPHLTLVAIAPLPLLAVVVYFFENRIHTTFQKVQERYSQLSSFVQESFAGIFVVKAFGNEKKRSGQFSHLNEHYVQENLRLAKLNALFDPMLLLIVALSHVLVFWFGGRDVLQGRFSVGELIAFVSYLETLAWPVMAVGFSVSMYQRGMASLKRIEEVAELPVPQRLSEGIFARRAEKSGPCDISVRNLKFSYDEKSKVFDGVSFDVRGGETVGVLGRIGSGKTTLARILTGQLDVPAGTVFVDGVDIMSWRLSGLRELMTCVPQEPFLFSATIEKNLRQGGQQASLNDVLKAARDADMADSILEMPKQWETVVGERGVNLSGGQKQRLTLARALLKPSPILILDDCFSSIDTETEERILTRMRPAIEKSTTLIITHRISTLRYADKIIVVENGRVVESGSHAELMERRGQYFVLYTKQQIAERLEKE